MDEMRDVAGITELQAIADCYEFNISEHEDTRRLEALLRNRQELIELIASVEEMDAAGFDAPDELAALFAKAKELDND